MDSKKLLVGAAMVGALLGATGCADSPSSSTIGQCHGVNACKGQGACGGTGHSCGGKNSCKGEGWIKSTQAKCQRIGGTFKSM